MSKVKSPFYSDSWSQTEYQTTKASYIWTIKDIRDFNLPVCRKGVGEYLQSPIFTTVVESLTTKWQMTLYPNGETEEVKDSISLFLSLVTPCPAFEMQTNFEFSIVNAKGVRLNPMRCATPFHGFSSSIKRNQLRNRQNCYFSGDRLNICCDLTITTSAQTLPPVCHDVYLKCSEEIKLAENLRSLLDSQALSDVTIVVEGREFKAHKNILSARSAVFSTMFQSQMKECIENKVDIDDLKARTFEIILEFIYTAKTPSLNIEELKNVLYAANKYALYHLKTICQVELSKVLSVDNAAQILILADFNNGDILKQRTRHYITSHLVEVLETEGWKCVENDHPSLLAEILHSSAKRIKLNA